MSRTFTPECPCGNGCEDSHDSRSFGPASCAVCVGDLCDDHAFNGGKVCHDCLSIENQLLNLLDPVAINCADDDETPELHLDDYAIKLKHFGEGYQPTSEEVMEVIREENPSCCDWHSQPEATTEQPCAAWQGGSNFAPNFGEEVQGEGEYDHENALFCSHIEHLIDTKNFAILQILEGWVDLDCPSCSNKIDFERDGDGCRADCFHCEVGSSLRWVLS